MNLFSNIEFQSNALLLASKQAYSEQSVESTQQTRTKTNPKMTK